MRAVRWRVSQTFKYFSNLFIVAVHYIHQYKHTMFVAVYRSSNLYGPDI